MPHLFRITMTMINKMIMMTMKTMMMTVTMTMMTKRKRREADIVPGVEVKEKAGTIQLPEEFSTVSLLFLGNTIHCRTTCHKLRTGFIGSKVFQTTCSWRLPSPGSCSWKHQQIKGNNSGVI